MQPSTSSTRTGDAVVRVEPDNLVTIGLYAAITGKSEKALRRKIEDGKIIEGVHYHRSPDGCVWIDREGMRKWVTGRE